MKSNEIKIQNRKEDTSKKKSKKGTEERQENAIAQKKVRKQI